MPSLEITVVKDGTTILHEVSDTQVTTTITTPEASLNLYKAPQQVDSFVAANPSLKAIADVPTGKWLGEWTGDVKAAVSEMAKDAAGKTMVLVAYNVPGRDNGQYSQGGAGSPEAYRNWIDDLCLGIGSAPAIVVIEPDGLGLAQNYSDDQKSMRIGLINYAASRLSELANCRVFIDASTWVAPADMAAMLNQTMRGIPQLGGFSCNVSGYMALGRVTAWAEQVALGTGMLYVVDTSRNGVGGNDGDWCNPVGQGLGIRPQLSESGKMWGALWLKAPGESDGDCNGGPSAGTFWLDRALELIKNDPFAQVPVGQTTTTTVQSDLLAQVKAIASVYGDHYQQMNQIRDLFGLKHQ